MAISAPDRPPARILAVGAHPDDIEFGCGGILLAEAARGAEISLSVCSRGEAASHGSPEEREAEARSAAGLLGATVEFMEMGGDCRIEATAANAVLLAREIRVFRPDIVLGPTAMRTQHPDHAAVALLCESAARLARYGGLEELRDLPPHRIAHLFQYAVIPAAEPAGERRTIRVDISAHFQRWIELMECHATQSRTRNYIELQSARARLLGVEAGVGYAQALFPTDDFLVKTLTELPASVRLF